MDSYKVTFQTWNKVASVYQEKFMDLDLYNDTYDRFCQLVEKQGARVFEIACGPGNITRYLLSKRPDFHIDAIDVAPNMIELAKKNAPTAHYQVMDVRELDKVDGTYDAIMCGFCMPYLSREDCAKLFNDCSHLLIQGGIAYFSTIEGDYSQSRYETASTGDQAYVYYYGVAELRQELEKNGFEIVDVQRKQFTKANNTSSTDLIIIAKKL